MTRVDRDRLKDILDAIEAIRDHIERRSSHSSVASDDLLHDAILFRFMVIGEAVNHLSDEVKARAPDVSWGAIYGLRNRITHVYFEISIDRVLEMVDNDLEPLETAIKRLLDS